MKSLITGILVLIGCQSIAQQVEVLIFREKLFDFGQVAEGKGNVNHEFVFTNNSGHAVKIVSVEASCGCTTPGWSKAPVAQGASGFIKASFDPKGRPGYFNKTLSVVTDADLATPVILQIKGEVVTGMPETKSELQVADGKLLFKTKTFNFETLYLNKPAVEKRFTVLNSGDSEIKFISSSSPSYIKVETPPVLPAHESGIIKVTYDAKAKNQYGFASDNIQLTTNDPGNEVKSISVFASLEDYFVAPIGKEALTVPSLLIREQSIDLGRSASMATVSRSVSVVNTGKKDLQIKALKGNCTCVTADMVKPVIKPGDSTLMNIQFTPQNRGGTQQKAIAIYSNDPKNPVQRISVQMFLEQDN